MGTRACTWLLVALVGLIGFGCRAAEQREAPPPQNEESGAADAAVAEDDVADTQASRPPRVPARPAGFWPPSYPPILPEGTVFAMLIAPDAVRASVAEGTDAMAHVESTIAAALRRAVSGGVGDLMSMMDTEAWERFGLDVRRPVLVALSVDESTGADAALEAIDIALNADPGSAEKALDAIAALRPETGFRVRIALPAHDAAAAAKWLTLAAPTLRATPADPIEGYDQVYAIDGQWLVGIDQTSDFLILDAALWPWMALDKEASLSRSRATLAKASTPGPFAREAGIPGPRGAVPHLFASVDLRALAALNALLVLGEEKASKHPQEALAGAKLATRVLGPEGAYRALAAELEPRGSVVVSAYFRYQQDAVAATLVGLPSLVPRDALASVEIAPSLAGLNGEWADAGLGPPKDIALVGLLDALADGHGLLPSLAPVWGTLVPGLVWRDLVPVPARYIRPGALERITLVASPGKGKKVDFALVMLDQGGDPKTHQHGLACMSQRRPVQGRCRDDRIVIGGTKNIKIRGEVVHYLIKRRAEDVLVVLGTSREIVENVANAPTEATATVARMRLDLAGLAAAELPAWLGVTLPRAGELVHTAEAEVVVNPDGLHWYLELEPPVALSELAGVAAPAVLEYVRKGQEVEAIVNLEVLVAHAAEVRRGSEAYPVADQPVCSAGGSPDGSYVSGTDTRWSEGVWAALNFSVPHQHLYRYCYHAPAGQGRIAAWAEASLGGDGLDSRFCIRLGPDEAGQGRVERLDEGASCSP